MVLFYVLGLQQDYTSQTGRFKLLNNLLALPMLPAEHIIHAFHALTINITDETTLKFVNYVRTTWLKNVTWTVTGGGLPIRQTRRPPKARPARGGAEMTK